VDECAESARAFRAALTLRRRLLAKMAHAAENLGPEGGFRGRKPERCRVSKLPP
jgi:hypothetical protein